MDTPLDLQNGRALAATLDIEDDGNGVLYPILDFEALTQQHRLVGTLRGRIKPDPLDVTLEPTQLLYNSEQVQLSSAHLMQNEEGDYVIENFKLMGYSRWSYAETRIREFRGHHSHSIDARLHLG